tara:strand:- start:694 stop:1257 length:564 start_codon:yes stop_codon:yes gene_type:complete
MVKKNACVFISGKGTNLKNLILKSRQYNFPITIKLVVTNNHNAKGIKYAKINSIPYIIISTKNRLYEYKILNLIKKYNISLICLAGYMKIISSFFLRNYKRKIINIHPSLLPKFKGLNTFERVLKNNEIKTGCTVHYVNEKLDSGNIINQKSFYIKKDDNLKILRQRTQKLEYQSFPEAIIKIYRYY